jgi:hypothetical protein
MTNSTSNPMKPCNVVKHPVQSSRGMLTQAGALPRHLLSDIDMLLQDGSKKAPAGRHGLGPGSA